MRAVATEVRAVNASAHRRMPSPEVSLRLGSDTRIIWDSLREIVREIEREIRSPDCRCRMAGADRRSD